LRNFKLEELTPNYMGLWFFILCGGELAGSNN
jgi:hypothetical protein